MILRSRDVPTLHRRATIANNQTTARARPLLSGMSSETDAIEEMSAIPSEFKN